MAAEEEAAVIAAAEAKTAASELAGAVSRSPMLREIGIAVVLSLLGCLIAGGALAGDDTDTLPMLLSSEHIGMTSDDFEAARAAERDAHARAQAEAAAEVEAQASAAAEEPLLLTARGADVETEWRSTVAGSAEPCPLQLDAVAEALSFEQCIERSIRDGNGYDESARVCRAVFPQPGAAK